MTDFDMTCPKCNSNKWKLRQEGANFNTTEEVTTLIGEYGDVIITCLKCGYTHEIAIGSD